ncbi:hypothetical protein HRG_004604 [Hirsutella rhossiliensis]|uniref:Uncharacterized protein n=1 Tax=Hirsutella rhossiliensis TaxID=111463 RepID=A0A9P8SKI5_9HYPO|nr:uncharacterized protein HRG_04604 [Hirsutella rhossiliensis]KAH0964176.1 hypothetical protein HRG_04604 [Hirsutella rhossiliensis]
MEMTRTPFIELGKSAFGGKTVRYGIRTGGFYLWPNLDDKSNERGVLNRSVLGINLNVTIEYRSAQPLGTPLSPRRRRREQRSSGEDSVESAQSDDINHEHGFVFAQIGALYYCADDDYDSDEGGPDRTDPDSDAFGTGPWWAATGFGAVVEVKHDGTPDAVWVVYNFYKAHEDSALIKGEHVPTLDDNDALLPHIGRLYKRCNEQFTVAKIADSLEDFKQPREEFRFEIAARDERQIVHAKLDGVHRHIQRQYINRSHRHAG